jgi:hypothetical protein
MAKRHVYRLCFFSGTRMAGTTHVRCDSDGEARNFAAKFPLVSRVEVWNGSRRVCDLPTGDSEKAGGAAAPKRETRVAAQHIQASRYLLDQRAGSVEQMIQQSKVAIEDSRQILARTSINVWHLNWLY